MKKTHRKRRGKRAVLIFFMTINLTNAPATSIPKRLLIYHALGRMKTSTTAIVMARMIEKTIIRGVLLRKMDVISIK
jgi:hypothetical protein